MKTLFQDNVKNKKKIFSTQKVLEVVILWSKIIIYLIFAESTNPEPKDIVKRNTNCGIWFRNRELFHYSYKDINVTAHNCAKLYSLPDRFCQKQPGIQL